MSENKFIKHLRGENTTGSLVEIKNQNTPASFANMPQGTSNPNVKYSDHRGNVTVVAKGTQNWKLSGASLVEAAAVNGDGTDYTGEFNASGSGLWINAEYSFPSTGDPNHPVSAIFNPGTKWVLKVCGYNLLSNNETLTLTLLVKIGSASINTKSFVIHKKALEFCQEFIIDYNESLQTLVKASGGTKLTVQLLCSDPTASATIYNGMTVLTALQRNVDASAVSSSFANVENFMQDIMDGQTFANDFFNNAAFINQVNNGDSALPIFQRNGDEMSFDGWADGDNKTVDIKNHKIEALGVLNKNTAAGASEVVYDWVGTKEEYYEQDVGGNHPDWVCFITNDDVDITTLYITADYQAANERLVMTSGSSAPGTKITQANYSNTYLRLILS